MGEQDELIVSLSTRKLPIAAFFEDHGSHATGRDLCAKHESDDNHKILPMPLAFAEAPGFVGATVPYQFSGFSARTMHDLA